MSSRSAFTLSVLVAFLFPVIGFAMDLMDLMDPQVRFNQRAEAARTRANRTLLAQAKSRAFELADAETGGAHPVGGVKVSKSAEDDGCRRWFYMSMSNGQSCQVMVSMCPLNENIDGAKCR